MNRFDVLGGASALFYIEENETLATVNKPESKMLSALFKDGEIQRIYYYDEAKNDGYPIVQLSDEEQRLKGFKWQPERRPADRNAVTPLSLRPSQRNQYAARPRATYTQTDIYFPGYMSDVYKQIQVRDSLKRLRERDRKIAEQRAAEKARLDSLALSDSLVPADSLAIPDSLDKKDLRPALTPASDSLNVAVDSMPALDTAAVKVLTPEELKAAAKAEKKAAKAKAKEEKKAKREAEKKRRQEAVEAKWAEKDKRDAEKAAAKEAKRLAKERRRKRKALEDAARQARMEAELLEQYRQKYLEQKAKGK
jgi:hypothetical protein